MSDNVERATSLLTLAITYLEDGAPEIAIMNTQEAIAFMRREAERRELVMQEAGAPMAPRGYSGPKPRRKRRTDAI